MKPEIKQKKIAASIESFYSKTIFQNLTSFQKMFFGSAKIFLLYIFKYSE